MERFAAPGFAAGAVTATSDRLELLESLKPAAACLHITAEKVAHQGIHGRVLLQRCLPGSLQQGIVDDEGEVGQLVRLNGSRAARVLGQQSNWQRKATSQPPVYRLRLFRNGNSKAVRIPAELAYEPFGDELRIRPAGRRITGALEALASFSPSFMADGREQDEQQEREAL